MNGHLDGRGISFSSDGYGRHMEGIIIEPQYASWMQEELNTEKVQLY